MSATISSAKSRRVRKEQPKIHLPTVSTLRFKNFLTTRAVTSATSRKASSTGQRAVERQQHEQELKDTQQIPIDMLAGEWLEDSGLSADARIYFVENLLPTVITGMERLLKEAEKRQVIGKDQGSVEEKMNPINFLAQYLMRNNPRFSVGAQSSPYMQALRKIQTDLKGKADDDTKSHVQKVRDEATTRATLISNTVSAERMEAVRKLGEGIPDLIGLVDGWKPDGVDTTNTAKLLGGFRSFTTTLEENDRVEAKIDVFPDLPEEGATEYPAVGDELPEIIPETLEDDEVIEYMHKYTKNIRAMPTSGELMPLLADHLTTWFDSQVNDSAMHDLAHKCNVLFLDLDMAQEKKIDRNLVMEALAQFTEETMVREAITEEADEDEDEDYLRRQSQQSPVSPSPPPHEKNLHQRRVSAPATVSTATVSPATGEAPDIEEEDVVDFPAEVRLSAVTENNLSTPLQSLDGSFNERSFNGGQTPSADVALVLQRSFRRKSVIKERRQSRHSSRHSGIGGSMGLGIIMESSVGRSEFKSSVIGTAGVSPSDELWNKLSTIFIDIFAAHREEQIKRYQEQLNLQTRLEKIEAVFHRIDLDCSGTIEVEELAPVMQEWKHMLEPEAVEFTEAMMRDFGPLDETGVLRLTTQAFGELMLEKFYSGMNHETALKQIESLNALLDKLMPDKERSRDRQSYLERIRAAGMMCCLDPADMYSEAMDCVVEDAEGTPAATLTMYVAEAEITNDEVGGLIVAAATANSKGVVGKSVPLEASLCAEAIKTGLSEITEDVNKGAKAVAFFGEEGQSPQKNGSAIVLPMSDPNILSVTHGITGMIGMDTYDGEPADAVFEPHQVRFFHGVARQVSKSLRQVTLRRKLLAIAYQSNKWVKTCSDHIVQISWFVVLLDDEKDSTVYRVARDSKGGYIAKKIERKLQNNYLFRTAETNEVANTKTGTFSLTSFPVINNNETCIMICNVKSNGRKGLGLRVERDINKVVRVLTQTDAVLDAGDVAPPPKQDVVAQCYWYTAEMEVDFLTEDMVYYDRFRLVELRSEFMKINKVMFDNLQAVKKPHVLLAKVVSLVLVAFLGLYRIQMTTSWTVCRKYCTEDLRRAITQFDPSLDTYRESLSHIEQELADIPRSALIVHRIQPIVVLLHDWLSVCCEIAKKAAPLRAGLTLPVVAETDHDDGEAEAADAADAAEREGAASPAAEVGNAAGPTVEATDEGDAGKASADEPVDASAAAIDTAEPVEVAAPAEGEAAAAPAAEDGAAAPAEGADGATPAEEVKVNGNGADVEAPAAEAPAADGAEATPAAEAPAEATPVAEAPAEVAQVAEPTADEAVPAAEPASE